MSLSLIRRPNIQVKLTNAPLRVALRKESEQLEDVGLVGQAQAVVSQVLDETGSQMLFGVTAALNLALFLSHYNNAEESDRESLGEVYLPP